MEAITRGDSKEVRRQLRTFLLGMLASPTSSPYSLSPSASIEDEKDVGNPKATLVFDDIHDNIPIPPIPNDKKKKKSENNRNEKNEKNVPVSLKEHRGRILTPSSSSNKNKKSKFKPRKSLKKKSKSKKSVRKIRKSNKSIKYRKSK